jgi:cbb3-type cytochrome oxidase subunit 3
MTSCAGADSERWCCGDNNSCCSSGVGLVTLPRAFGDTVVASSSLSIGISTALVTVSKSTSSASIVASTTSSASSTHLPTKEKSGLEAGGIAGIAIGAVVFLLLLVAGIILILRAKRQKHTADKANVSLAPSDFQHKSELHANNTAELPQYSEKYARNHVGEMDGVPVAELQGSVSELDGSEVRQGRGR